MTHDRFYSSDPDGIKTSENRDSGALTKVENCVKLYMMCTKAILNFVKIASHMGAAAHGWASPCTRRSRVVMSLSGGGCRARGC
jgi:hypothetical protein